MTNLIIDGMRPHVCLAIQAASKASGVPRHARALRIRTSKTHIAQYPHQSDFE
ncbi:hypothetical protein [Paraburkholderia ferrariae]|jgi:hypothetical protein|uniref:hypothetical protein n=1 Tax=Paraburkholderia ferrariae TaxID=386056 RepID=UPI0012EC4E7E|nr:hypothetical protein [Paraburkholderia ferrariae]